MEKTLLLCILLTTSCLWTTTEQSTLPPPSDQKPTVQPNQETPEPATDAFDKNNAKIIPPTPKALRTLTPMETITPILTAQNQSVATTNAIKQASSTEMSMSTLPFESSYTSTIMDFATSSAPNPESTTQAINGSQSFISGTIPAATEIQTSSIQTSTMATETIKVLVQTGGATTRAAPTAKLSATTEMLTKTATSVQNATDSGETTYVAQTKESSSTQFVPIVPKTTAKVDRTTKTTKNAEVTKGEEAHKLVKHGKIAAGLIGGALLVMMIGFLVILYKKHKLKKHQIATTDWAGPTPFLETGGGRGGDNGHVTLRSASRISLTSFLPQRLSKRLSLLAESTEEMQDMQEMTEGTTFTSEKSAKETEENDSEISGKTEEVDLVDETKENEGEESKGKQNGQAVMRDEEKGEAENAATESRAKEAGIEKNGEGEKEGVDNV